VIGEVTWGDGGLDLLQRCGIYMPNRRHELKHFPDGKHFQDGKRFHHGKGFYPGKHFHGHHSDSFGHASACQRDSKLMNAEQRPKVAVTQAAVSDKFCWMANNSKIPISG